MWKKPKKKKVLAPTTEFIKRKREEEYERLTKNVNHKTTKVG